MMDSLARLKRKIGSDKDISDDHPAAFINQPVAAPHQPFLPIGSEVPLVKKSSFPPGEAKKRIAVGCS